MNIGCSGIFTRKAAAKPGRVLKQCEGVLGMEGEHCSTGGGTSISETTTRHSLKRAQHVGTSALLTCPRAALDYFEAWCGLATGSPLPATGR
ncbi:hypothetical protein J2Y48_002447 [Mycoplana sp. BE70]|nr:hypothetical protein [Mycoplana sp. BE70]